MCAYLGGIDDDVFGRECDDFRQSSVGHLDLKHKLEQIHNISRRLDRSFVQIPNARVNLYLGEFLVHLKLFRRVERLASDFARVADGVE